MASSDLELFDVELVQEFHKVNITSVVDYENSIIIGDSQGNIIAYKREKSKLSQFHQIQLKSKIENLIVMRFFNRLLALSGGTIYIYELPTFLDITSKEDK